jgi:SAM-dependent methyltransferase
VDEPFLSEFKQLIRAHAASRDVHDGSDVGFAALHGDVDDAFVAREIERVRTHQRSLLPLLEPTIGRVGSVLDFGCGTGGTTVALALSDDLGASSVIGVDANPRAVDAAVVRAAGHRVGARCSFRAVPAGDELPFDDASFDLVVTVSVLEFITDTDARQRAVEELARVTRPGGHLFVATPRPWLREYHSDRWLGDLRIQPGFPWSSRGAQLRGWLPGWTSIDLGDALAAVVASRRPRIGRIARLPAIARVLPHLGRWQKLLFGKPRTDIRPAPQ